MTHGLSSTINCLRRWAAHCPDQLMPDDWSAYQRNNLDDAIRVESAYPQLVQLLKGTAPAALRADALAGDFSAEPPNPAEQASARRQQRVREITDALLQGPNLTLAMELAQLSPADYAAYQQDQQPDAASARQQQERRSAELQERLLASKVQAQQAQRRVAAARGIESWAL